jgi:enamine deaminase RidA (YjgF/YER057c/UK114 family)
MTESTRRYLNPETLSKPTGYTHVVEARGSRNVYISGQVAFDAQGQIVGIGDLEAQTEQVFRNLQAALTAAGATFADVVKMTYYLLDMRQIGVVRTVRERYLPDLRPASTAVGVNGLAHPDFLVEIEAIAVLTD